MNETLKKLSTRIEKKKNLKPSSRNSRTCLELGLSRQVNEWEKIHGRNLLGIGESIARDTT